MTVPNLWVHTLAYAQWNSLIVTHATQFPISEIVLVGILPHLQNVDVFPSLTSVRHPVGDVAHDKSTVGAA